MMRRRRVALVIASLALVGGGSLVALPYFFREKIVARMQAEFSQRARADISWEAVHMSLVRDFPHATMRVEGLRITGQGAFLAETLAVVPAASVELSLPSVVRMIRGQGAARILSVQIARPQLHLRVLEDGQANWRLFRPRPGQEAAPSFSLSLRRVEITGGEFTLEDRASDVSVRAAGITQRLSGNVSDSLYRMQGRTGADSLWVRFAGIPYLSRSRVALDAAVTLNPGRSVVEVQRADLQVNALRLQGEGSVGIDGDSARVELSLRSPEASFRDVLSLIPPMYSEPSFASLQTEGQVAVSGWVRGSVSPRSVPAFSLLVKVDQGRFQYPDLPLAIRDVGLNLSVSHPGGSSLDSTVVDLHHMQLKIGPDLLKASGSVRTPLSDPEGTLRVQGKVTLSDVQRALKLSKVEALSGMVDLNLALQARRSALEAKQYDQIQAEGSLHLAGIQYRGPGISDSLEVEDAQLSLTPTQLRVERLRARMGQSDVELTGRFEDVLPYLFWDRPLRGDVRVKSARLDLNPYRSEDPIASVPLPANWHLRLDAQVDRLVIADLELRNAQGGLILKEAKASLEEMRMGLFGGQIRVAGFYETSDPMRPTFDVQVQLQGVDIPEVVAGARTVRAFAPIARFTQGRISSDVRLQGTLGEDMSPILEELSGEGEVWGQGLRIRSFPALEKLGDYLKIEALRSLAVEDVRTRFQIQEGRLHVRAFDVGVGPLTMTVSGSQGMDETMDYRILMQLPRPALGEGANRVLDRLAASVPNWKARGTGGGIVSLGIRLGGTVDEPSVAAEYQGSAASIREAVGQGVQEQVERQKKALGEKADSAKQRVREKVGEQSERLRSRASEEAEAIRAETRRRAESLRKEAYQKADALVDNASNPAARAAARFLANRLRRQADEQAEQMIRDASVGSDSVSQPDSVPPSQ